MINKKENMDLHERKKNMEASQEYKIYRRLKYLDFTWSLCNDNKVELFEIINNLEQTINMLFFQIYDGIISLLSRRLINHIGTISLFVDHMRNENRFLEKSGINIGYKEKVDEYFLCNPNTQFVHGLRNFIIHNKIIKPEIESHIINEELNISKLTLNTNVLLQSKKWNKYAKEYILQNSPKINLKICLTNYFAYQEKFYNWFKAEYRQKYISEITYCENIINEWNIFIEKKRVEFEKMSFEKLISLPQLICTSENGFTITRVE